MFMKTGRKNLGADLFSPVRKWRFTSMSILLSTVFPLALSGITPPAAAAPAPVVSPAVTLPSKAAAQPVMVKVAPLAAAPRPLSAPDARPQTLVELIQIRQSPLPSPQAAASAADRAQIIDRVSEAFTEVRTAQGRFTQTDAMGDASSGSFYISRPGKVRFDYTSPERMHIVSDGTSVSIEEPKRKAYDAVPLSSTPLHLFLRSNVDLKRDGSVTDVTTTNGSHFVTLVDKTGEAEGKMILEFRASDFELLGWRALDGAGAETRVRLLDTKKNVSLKPSLFVVKSPEDERR
jgi:outer membrane lipoprotein-sorting protein